MKNQKKNKGFTLVELLVVVAIIGILAGIVVVSMSSARERTRRSSVQSTLASATTIASMCLNEGESLNTVNTASTICSNTNTEVSTELWPALPANIASDYSYALDDPADPFAIVGSQGATAVVTCCIANGSCQNGGQTCSDPTP